MIEPDQPLNVGDEVIRIRDGARGTVIATDFPFVVRGPSDVCPFAVNFEGDDLTSSVQRDEIKLAKVVMNDLVGKSIIIITPLNRWERLFWRLVPRRMRWRLVWLSARWCRPPLVRRIVSNTQTTITVDRAFLLASRPRPIPPPGPDEVLCRTPGARGCTDHRARPFPSESGGMAEKFG